MKFNPPSSDSFTVISGLAHELDSPLKSILMRTQKLINDYKNRDFEYISYKDFKVIISTLKQLENQLEHCSKTTSRMLYVGKRHARLEENSCQVNDVIRDIAGDLSQQFRAARVKLVSRLGKELPLVAVGPVECHQIIHNVIINAIQAMPGGGIVRVRTFLDKARGGIGIDVTDEGVGIAPEHLPKVFEPFFSVNESGKGSCLGLALSHGIIEKHKGRIEVDSRPNEGTTFKVYFPSEPKAAA